MGFPHRIIVDGGVYHVMNRGAARQTVFSDDRDRVEFGRLLGEIHERFAIETLAYCLMDNHYHLLLRCPGGSLSEAMQHLSSVYTRHANERAGRDGSLFRGRFTSKLVDSDPYLLTAVRYIHRNALDVIGVGRVEEYRWSSHRAYLGLRRAPEFLNLDVVMDYFGGDHHRFARFVTADGDSPVDVDCSDVSDDLDGLRSLAWLAVTESVAETAETNTAAMERTVLLLLVDAFDRDRRRRLLSQLGHPNDAARDNALSRARRRARDSWEVQKAVELASDELRLGRRAA